MHRWKWDLGETQLVLPFFVGAKQVVAFLQSWGLMVWQCRGEWQPPPMAVGPVPSFPHGTGQEVTLFSPGHPLQPSLSSALAGEGKGEEGKLPWAPPLLRCGARAQMASQISSYGI